MNKKIHFETIGKLFKEKFGVEIEQKECVNNQTGEVFDIIFEKGADVAIFSIRENDEYVCLNSNGDEIDKDKIYSIINGINVSCDNTEMIISPQNLKLRYMQQTIAVEEILKREAELYPERTSILLKGMFTRNGMTGLLTNFYVDEIAYASKEQFDEICRGDNSELLKEYNKKTYETTPNATHGILVIGPEGDGLMVDTSGYDYARYMSYAPKIGIPIEYMLEREMRQKATHEMKLYVPLKITEYDEDFEERETDGRYYFNDIRKKVRESLLEDGERGLAKYLDTDNKCKNKVYSIKPDIERVENTLMGVAVIKMTKPLSETEIDDLKEYVTGQFSDGWGESFEQHEIQVSGGEIYVHFWNSEEFYIKTEEEMEQTQTMNEGIQGMSGMQGM